MSMPHWAGVVVLCMGFAAISEGITAAADVPAYAPLAAPETDLAPQTTEASDRPVEALLIMVRPMTREQLEVEAWALTEMVRQKAAEVAAVELQLRDVGERAAEELPEDVVEHRRNIIESLNTVRAERSALVERADIVIDALGAKGGDVEMYRQYLDVASGGPIDVTDAGAAMAGLIHWLKSPDGGMRVLRNIILFIVALIVTVIIARIAGNATRRALMRANNVSELLRDFLVKSVTRTIILIGLIVALTMLQINVSPLVAAIGGAAFVVAFALQGTLSNFASGIMILVYRPFDVGDAIDVAGTSGIVESMTLVSTKIRTFDNRAVVIPNNNIWGNVITNFTGKDTRRVDLTFGISYSDDIDKARAILEELVKGHELVLVEPEPLIRLHELGDSSVNIICRPWTKTGDYWTVYWDLMQQVKQRFDAEGITIPFPQRDLHIYQESTA